MKKTLLGILISLCLLSVSFFAFACDEKEEKDLTVSKTEITLEKYGHGFLTATYGGDDSLEFVWKSNDENVVEVVDGQLTGKSEGETVVNASYGNKTAECKVKVTAPDANKLSLDAGKDLNLYVNDVIQLEPTLRYSNIPIDGVKYGYNSSDDKTVTVDENGKITAVAMGNAFISVECEAEGKKFTKVVSVSVEQEYSVEIEQRNVALYPVSEYKGQTYTNQMEFTSVVKKRGAEIKADGVEWTCEVGQNIIELVGNKATAKNVGETKITAKYSGEFGFVSDEVTVKVNPIDVTLDGVTVDLSVMGDYEPDKDAKIKNIIDEDVLSLTVKIAGIDECTFKVNEGKVNFGLNENVKSGNATVKYVTNKFSYTVDAVFYDLLIDSPEDLELLSADVKFAKLVNDIDMKDYGTWTSTVDFFGTFDGGGHAIKNLTASGSGLFKNVNGTVKDLALIDVTTIGSTGALAYSYVRTGVGSLTVENVVMSYKTANTAWLASGLFRQLNVSSPILLKNLLVYIPTTTNSSCGYISGKVSGIVTVENCLFVGGYQEQLTYSGDDWVLTIKGNDGELAVKGEDYFTYSDLDVFAEDYQGGKITSTEMVEDYAELLISKQITLIDSSNVADLLTATSGVYMLTEDIDMATAYTDNDGVWAPSANFSGTFNGAGHTISNLNIAGSKGLFYELTGTVKNLALTNVTTTNQGGILCYNGNNSKIENVVIHVKSVPKAFRVGVIGRANTGSITAKDLVVISEAGQNIGLFVGYTNLNPALTNCYFVGKGNIIGEIWAGSPAPTGTYKTYADIESFKTEYEKTESEISLTDFGKGVVDGLIK